MMRLKQEAVEDSNAYQNPESTLYRDSCVSHFGRESHWPM